MKPFVTELRPTVSLALPITAGHVGQMLMGWADTIMVGHLGVVPLAGSAFANTVLMVPFVFGFGLISAVAVRSSLGFGSGEPKKSGLSLRAGCWLAGGVGLLVVALIAALMGSLHVFGQPTEVNAAVKNYLLLCTLSVVPALISTSAKNFAEALSRPWIPFWILMTAVGLNVFLNWVFIYGNLGAPALGLDGAGLATLLARIFGAVAMVAYPLVSPSLSGPAQGSWFSPEIASEIRELVKLGLPVGTMHLAEVSGFSAGSIMLGWLGVTPLAAHQIAITCAATTFMFPLGLAQAVSVRVGQARGSMELHRCRPIVWGALLLSAGIMGIFAMVFIFCGHPIASIFTTDPELAALAAKLLLLAGFFQIFDGLQVVSSGALRGFEDVTVPMVIGASAYWAIALPISYYFAFFQNMGAVGVWIGFSAGLAFAAFALITRLVRRLRIVQASL